MAKPDPALLNPDRFPFHVDIATRFGDLDLNKHINNVAMVGILEDARVRFHAVSGFHIALSGFGAMVASIAVEYLGQAFHPAPINVGVAATHVGRSSYTMMQLVRQEGRIVAFAEAVMVCVGSNGPAPIPDIYRDGIGPWMLRG
ncbi:MAG: hypothetical protein RLY97_558 [Pseudomonadota bacterium]|jgi:acyl-CoA thioester hydrolase